MFGKVFGNVFVKLLVTVFADKICKIDKSISSFLFFENMKLYKLEDLNFEVWNTLKLKEIERLIHIFSDDCRLEC